MNLDMVNLISASLHFFILDTFALDKKPKKVHMSNFLTLYYSSINTIFFFIKFISLIILNQLNAVDSSPSKICNLISSIQYYQNHNWRYHDPN